MVTRDQTAGGQHRAGCIQGEVDKVSSRDFPDEDITHGGPEGDVLVIAVGQGNDFPGREGPSGSEVHAPVAHQNLGHFNVIQFINDHIPGTCGLHRERVDLGAKMDRAEYREPVGNDAARPRGDAAELGRQEHVPRGAGVDGTGRDVAAGGGKRQVVSRAGEVAERDVPAGRADQALDRVGDGRDVEVARYLDIQHIGGNPACDGHRTQGGAQGDVAERSRVNDADRDVAARADEGEVVGVAVKGDREAAADDVAARYRGQAVDNGVQGREVEIIQHLDGEAVGGDVDRGAGEHHGSLEGAQHEEARGACIQTAAHGDVAVPAGQGQGPVRMAVIRQEGHIAPGCGDEAVDQEYGRRYGQAARYVDIQHVGANGGAAPGNVTFGRP